MGVFDTVIVPCPACGEPGQFQSKSGACCLETYTLDEAPDEVLMDINRHSPQRCHKCGALYAVEVSGTRPRRMLNARAVLWNGDVDQDERG